MNAESICTFFKDIEFILSPVRGKAMETKSGCSAGQPLNGKRKLREAEEGQARMGITLRSG
jgi:hypothetical protein